VAKPFLTRSLQVLAIMFGVAVLPAIGLSLYTGYYMMVPRYSAVVEFDKLGFNLRVDLFLTDDELRDSGRYLNVINGGSYHSFGLGGWDWAHRARTSIYRIDDNHLGVLSAFGYDYVVTLKPFATAPVALGESGEGWQYLGAFEFAFPAKGKPRLEFFPPEDLAECVPMGMHEPGPWPGRPRAAVRQATCPTATLP
jgi:hypothetical protein